MTGSFRGFLEFPEQDRRDVFAAAAQRIGTLPTHVEKDFWVCLVLDLLFGGLPAGFRGRSIRTDSEGYPRFGAGSQPGGVPSALETL